MLEIKNGLDVHPNPPSKENIDGYMHYIRAGQNLIITGRYKDAITHFKNKVELQKVGFKLGFPREVLSADPKTPEEIAYYANLMASFSWFKKDSLTLEISNVHTQEPTPITLLQEISLVALEEWLHGAQYLFKRSLTGYKDHEIDVANYMHQNRILLTNTFLLRYDRGMVLFNNPGADDSMTKLPAFRRGTFVRVIRTSGVVEEDWQINGFNEETGDAFVRKKDPESKTGILQKEIPISELVDLNKTGVYPFQKARRFEDLFAVINELRRIDGYQVTFDAQTLITLINNIRMGTGNIESIPRSGGLRLKVTELLGKNYDASHLRSHTVSIRN